MFPIKELSMGTYTIEQDLSCATFRNFNLDTVAELEALPGIKIISAARRIPHLQNLKLP